MQAKHWLIATAILAPACVVGSLAAGPVQDFLAARAVQAQFKPLQGTWFAQADNAAISFNSDGSCAFHGRVTTYSAGQKLTARGMGATAGAFDPGVICIGGEEYYLFKVSDDAQMLTLTPYDRSGEAPTSAIFTRVKGAAASVEAQPSERIGPAENVPPGWSTEPADAETPQVSIRMGLPEEPDPATLDTTGEGENVDGEDGAMYVSAPKGPTTGTPAFVGSWHLTDAYGTKGLELTLNKDRSFRHWMPQGAVTGNWTLQGDGRTLVMTYGEEIGSHPKGTKMTSDWRIRDGKLVLSRLRIQTPGGKPQSVEQELVLQPMTPAKRDRAASGGANSPVGTWRMGATSFTFRSDGTVTERNSFGSADGTWRKISPGRIEVRYTKEGTAWAGDWQIRDEGRFLNVSSRREVHRGRSFPQYDATFKRQGSGSGLVGSWANGDHILTFKSDGTLVHFVPTSLGESRETGKWVQRGDELEYTPARKGVTAWRLMAKGLATCQLRLSADGKTLTLSDHRHQPPGASMPDLDLERQ